MRLISIALCNFRSFYGESRIEFSDDVEKSVTVFHGENGSGKTTLLNAIFWCFTGTFTPSLNNPNALVNKEAFKQGVRECYVELVFDDGTCRDIQYRIRRTSTNVGEIGFDVFKIDRGNTEVLQNGPSIVRKLLPPGLAGWFFFDAEAIGSLQLTGSAGFKRDLRKTLGFELVDLLLKDLTAVLDRRNKQIANLANDRDLKKIAAEIENINMVMPNLYADAAQYEKEIDTLTVELGIVRDKLANQPKAEPLERERRRIEFEIQKRSDEKNKLMIEVSDKVGSFSPALASAELAQKLEGILKEKDDRGVLPAPFSTKLVNEIIEDQICICGRPVLTGTPESDKIKSLLNYAATTILKDRIQKVNYLILEIEGQARDFPLIVQKLRTNIANIDIDIGRLESDWKELNEKIKSIDDTEAKALELKREDLDKRLKEMTLQAGGILKLIDNNEIRRREFQERYDVLARKVQGSNKLRAEVTKTERLISYVQRVSQQQEKQALRILSFELNNVLKKYLTKHYTATIDAKTYEVVLKDQDGKRVGHSTGEGQVLKFAFIAAVIAMAARKTAEKIQWLSEPTVAPLVLDAPFSVLDVEYQGSVAKNLADQITQLILMISSAGWLPSVETALDKHVGKRYLIVSKETGPRDDKPVKKVTIRGKTYELNEYNAPISESVFVEVK